MVKLFTIVGGLEITILQIHCKVIVVVFRFSLREREMKRLILLVILLGLWCLREWFISETLVYKL